MLPRRQQANGYPIPPPLRTARDVRAWAAQVGADPALVALGDDGYPYEDGFRTMSYGERHSRQLLYGVTVLEARYGDRPDVYVSGDVYVHGERDGRTLSAAPVVCVAFGIWRRPGGEANQSYRIGHNGPAPSFVLEVLSESTKARDLGAKRGVYAHFGVAEYWLFDPWAEDVPGHAAGLRPRGDAYEPIGPQPDGSTRSAVLGVDTLAEAGNPRFRDAATGDNLLDLKEEQALHRQAQAMLDAARAAHREEQAMLEAARAARLQEQAMRRAAEAELARLRALLDRDR